MLPRRSRSAPTAATPRYMSGSAPAMVISCTGVRDLAVLDPEAGRAAGIVAGDRVDALPQQLGHPQPAVQPRQQRLRRQFLAVRLQHQVAHAAGVAGRLEPQPARRVGAEEPFPQHPVVHHRALPGAHAVGVERRAGDAAGLERPLDQAEAARPQRLAEAPEQERGLPVQRGPGGGGREMPQQRAGQRRVEQHRRGAALQRPGAQPARGARRRGAADGGRLLQPPPVAGRAPPVVALLGAVAGGGDHAAAEAVLAARVAGRGSPGCWRPDGRRCRWPAGRPRNWRCARRRAPRPRTRARSRPPPRAPGPRDAPGPGPGTRTPASPAPAGRAPDPPRSGGRWRRPPPPSAPPRPDSGRCCPPRRCAGP